MMMSLFTLLMATMTFSLFISFNPLTLGIMILFMALTLSMLFAMSMSSWVAFLIFLIYIGGMLVMFSYFVALIPNQNLSISYTLIMFMTTFATLFMIMIIMDLKSPMMEHLSNQFNIMYVKSNVITLIFLAWLLLFTMIVVVKTVSHSKGPLRPFS